MNSSLRLKNARNWFAAGVEVQQALELLTDGPFKVFMYICLNAERRTGILHATQVELARTLKKSNGTIRKYLGELERAGVCRNNFSNNPVTRGSVQISPSYWPYETEGAQAPTDDAGAEKFIAEIRKLLGERACVRSSSFSTADEVLARQWFSTAVPLDRIAQAILLGCARKYVAWRNNQAVQEQMDFRNSPQRPLLWNAVGGNPRHSGARRFALQPGSNKSRMRQFVRSAGHVR